MPSQDTDHCSRPRNLKDWASPEARMGKWTQTGVSCGRLVKDQEKFGDGGEMGSGETIPERFGVVWLKERMRF